MRAVVQRVLSASVTGLFFFLSWTSSSPRIERVVSVNNEVVSEISRGLMVLVGIGVGT